MHLIFERSQDRFQSGCNILALAWMPYHVESKFRKALFDYHQRQLLNLPSGSTGQSVNGNNHAENNQIRNQIAKKEAVARHNFINSRLAELYERYIIFNSDNSSQKKGDKIDRDAMRYLDTKYGRLPEFGWLVMGNIGKIIGITLTSTVPPPIEQSLPAQENETTDEDLIKFQDDITTVNDLIGQPNKDSREPSKEKIFEHFRPDRRKIRTNYNLRGHLDEVILVKWNDLYQKLATVDSKGNVLIWCKINEKFSLQTPFYNRTKSVADFQWSNDGRTALICYTDSFILVGSSTGQRHWHSMLNLEDYHITCASWTPNDEQLLLGVSNGNIVVIHLPHSELTEMVVGHTNIRAMSWSSNNMNLNDINKTRMSSGQDPANNIDYSSIVKEDSRRKGSAATIVNQRRLSRDCSVFSRYKYCSQTTSGSYSCPRPSNDAVEIPQEPTNLENSDASSDSPVKLNLSKEDQGSNILAIDFSNNTIQLFEGSLEDQNPKLITTNLESYIMQWSSDGQILAVAGFNIHTAAPSVGCIRCRYLNALKFYDRSGYLIYERNLGYTRYPITAFTWAHDNRRIFVATGPRLLCAKVFFGIPKLSLLAMSTIQSFTKTAKKEDIWYSLKNGLISLNALSWQGKNCPIDLLKLSKSVGNSKKFNDEKLSQVNQSLDGFDCESLACKNLYQHNSNNFVLNLPQKLRLGIDQLSSFTIRPPFESCLNPRDIIWHVPKYDQRIYCTLVCYTNEREVGPSANYNYRADWSSRFASGDNQSTDQYRIFILYVEFQGFYFPILRARRVGFLKPEFVIFDPDGQKQLGSRRKRKVSDSSEQPSLSSYLRRHMLATNQSQTYSQLNESGHTSCRNISPIRSIENHNCISSLHEPITSSPIKIKNMYDKSHDYLDSGNYNQIDPDKTRKVKEKHNLLIDHRSHHQEPIAMPVDTDSRLIYRVSMYPRSTQTSTIKYLPGIAGQSQLIRPGWSNKENPAKKSHNNQNGIPKGIETNFSLSEQRELVRIKSNIWGTKFKLINEPNRLIKSRSVLASVVYRASILHLQPRRIFLRMREMSNYCCLCSKYHHRDGENQSKIEKSKKLSQIDDCVNLLDSPTPATSKPVRIARERSIKNRSKDKSREESEKIILSVGDNIRVAPSLELNQRYKLTDQRGSPIRANREHRRRQSEDSKTRRSRSQSGTNISHKLVDLGRSNSQIGSVHEMQYSPWRQRKDSDVTKKRPLPLIPMSQSVVDRDDTITVSLGQGDQVKVAMSAHCSLEYMRQRATENVSENKEASENKTLESIQAVTQMIVHLTEKAKKDNSPGKTSKSNLADQDNMVDRIENLKSSHFIPPDTPVHRPRRLRSRPPVDQSLPRQLSLQSETLCSPLRSSHRAQPHQRPKRLSRLDMDSHVMVNREKKLPDPPPSMSLSRRFSSSAKRLFDGSIRSLSNLSGFSGSDIEPEENEPLIEGSIRFGHRNNSALAKGALFLQDKHASQPSSPTRVQGSSMRSQQKDSNRSSRKPKAEGVSRTKREWEPAKRARSVLDEFRGSTNNKENMRLEDTRKNQKYLAGSDAIKFDPNEDDSLTDFTLSSHEDLRSEMSDLDSDLDVEYVDKSRYLKGKTKTRGSRRELLRRFSSLAELSNNKWSRNDKEQDVEPDTNDRRFEDGPSRKKTLCRNNNCCCAKELSLKNRPPIWNQISQVYQLDFGGRVTQESAKNLQIDYDGNLVSNLVLSQEKKFRTCMTMSCISS